MINRWCLIRAIPIGEVAIWRARWTDRAGIELTINRKIYIVGFEGKGSRHLKDAVRISSHFPRDAVGKTGPTAPRSTSSVQRCRDGRPGARRAVGSRSSPTPDDRRKHLHLICDFQETED